MTDTRKQHLIFILASISLAISCLVLIPFGSSTLSHTETVIKFIVCPLIVLGLNIVITTKKFEDYRPVNRLTSFASYLPTLSYFLSLVVYCVFLVTRGDFFIQFTQRQFVMLMIILGTCAIMTLISMFLLDRLAIKFTRFTVMLFDIAIMVAYFINVMLLKSKIANVFEKTQLINHSPWHTFALVALAIFYFVALFYRTRSLYVGNGEFTSKDKAVLLEKWQTLRDSEYYQGELNILYSLVNYSADRLSIDLYKQDKTKAAQEANAKVDKLNSKVSKLQTQLKEIKEREAIEHAKNHKMSLAYAELKNQVKVEVATAELEAAKKEYNLINDSLEKNSADYQADLNLYEDEKNELESKMAAIEKEKEEVAAKIKPVEEKPVEVAPTRTEEKKEKVFALPYDELAKYAQSVNQPDVNVVANPKGTQHKFTTADKPYLIMQKTSSDYRVTFMVSEEKQLEYLQGFPGLITVASTPKDGHWLKLVNKGDMEEAFIKKLVDESVLAMLAYEKAKVEAKEAARLAKEAEKAEEQRRKEEEKANREKLRLAEKILADNEKEAARQAKEAEREAIRQAKAAEKAAKEAEKARIAAEKEAEREAKEEAARQAKETELAMKEQELRAKEAELQAAEKEAAKKAKEAEKLVKKAEKEAEKLVKEAEKEAARKAEEAA